MSTYTLDEDSIKRLRELIYQFEHRLRNAERSRYADTSDSPALEMLIGKAAENITGGGSGKAAIWMVSGSTEQAESAWTEKVYDWFGTGAFTGDKLKIWRHAQSDRLYFERLYGLLGKTSGAISKGSSGTVRAWPGAPGSEADSGQDVTAFNRFGDIATTKWVWLDWSGYGWYATAAECG